MFLLIYDDPCLSCRLNAYIYSPNLLFYGRIIISFKTWYVDPKLTGIIIFLQIIYKKYDKILFPFLLDSLYCQLPKNAGYANFFFLSLIKL